MRKSLSIKGESVSVNHVWVCPALKYYILHLIHHQDEIEKDTKRTWPDMHFFRAEYDFAGEERDRTLSLAVIP